VKGAARAKNHPVLFTEIIVMRDPDATIPANELLFRSVKVEHVDGDVVHYTAVEMPRCSFNRAEHSEPNDVLVVERPEHTGIVSAMGGNLPPAIPRSGAAALEFFVRDDPNPPEDPSNIAHAEICVKPVGTGFKPKWTIASKTVKITAREELARKLKVHTPPRPAAGVASNGVEPVE